MNIPIGYVYLRNFIYREDGELRSPYASSAFGNPVGTGQIDGVFDSTDGVYVLNNDSLYFSDDNGDTWTEGVWKGSGSSSLPKKTLNYDFFDRWNMVVFTSPDSSEPTYMSYQNIWDPPSPDIPSPPDNPDPNVPVMPSPFYPVSKDIVYQFDNHGRTHWCEKSTKWVIPKSTGSIYYTFPENEVPGMSNNYYIYGDGWIYNIPLLGHVNPEKFDNFDNTLRTSNIFLENGVRYYADGIEGSGDYGKFNYNNGTYSTTDITPIYDYCNQFGYEGSPGGRSRGLRFWTRSPSDISLTFEGHLLFAMDGNSNITGIYDVCFLYSYPYSYVKWVDKGTVFSGGNSANVNVNIDFEFYDWNNEKQKTINFTKEIISSNNNCWYCGGFYLNTNFHINEDGSVCFLINTCISDAYKSAAGYYTDWAFYFTNDDGENWTKIQDYMELASHPYDSYWRTVLDSSGDDKIFWFVLPMGNDILYIKSDDRDGQSIKPPFYVSDKNYPQNFDQATGLTDSLDLYQLPFYPSNDNIMFFLYDRIGTNIYYKILNNKLNVISDNELDIGFTKTGLYPLEKSMVITDDNVVFFHTKDYPSYTNVGVVGIDCDNNTVYCIYSEERGSSFTSDYMFFYGGYIGLWNGDRWIVIF